MAKRKIPKIAYNRDFGYLFILTYIFVYLFIFSAFLYISKSKKNFSKKTRRTSLKAYRNISKTEKNISKKPRNSQHTSYPFSSFTMMRAALSGAEV